jgi:hypothetical protein
MKRVLVGAVMAALLVAGVAVVRAAIQDFTVTNKTGFTITALYVSETDNDDWEDDVLGEDVLANGKSTDISFHGYSGKACKFDIRIDDEDSTQWIVEDINLCETHKVTFKKSGSKVVYEAQ